MGDRIIPDQQTSGPGCLATTARYGFLFGKWESRMVGLSEPSNCWRGIQLECLRIIYCCVKSPISFAPQFSWGTAKSSWNCTLHGTSRGLLGPGADAGNKRGTFLGWDIWSANKAYGSFHRGISNSWMLCNGESQSKMDDPFQETSKWWYSYRYSYNLIHLRQPGPSQCWRAQKSSQGRSEGGRRLDKKNIEIVFKINDKAIEINDTPIVSNFPPTKTNGFKLI